MFYKSFCTKINVNLKFRLQENEKEDALDQMKSELEELEKVFEEKVAMVTHCEDVIEQLSQEVNQSQDELSRALDKGTQGEGQVASLKERLQQTQQEVRRFDQAAFLDKA